MSVSTGYPDSLGSYQHPGSHITNEQEKVFSLLGHMVLLADISELNFQICASWPSVAQKVWEQGFLQGSGCQHLGSLLSRCTTEPSFCGLNPFLHGHCMMVHFVSCVKDWMVGARGLSQPASCFPGPVPRYKVDSFNSGPRHHLLISHVPFGLRLPRGVPSSWHKGLWPEKGISSLSILLLKGTILPFFSRIPSELSLKTLGFCKNGKVFDYQCFGSVLGQDSHGKK